MLSSSVSDVREKERRGTGAGCVGGAGALARIEGVEIALRPA